MTKVTIAPVSRDEIPQLDVALRALSSEMGDRHIASVETLKTAFTSGHSAFNALLAHKAGHVVGALVWTPVFSTTRGGGGLFVSDLWVAPSVRGCGIGKKLLERAISVADSSSGALFLKLAVHRTNPSAYTYYTHLGFKEEADMSTMILEDAPLQSLKNH